MARYAYREAWARVLKRATRPERRSTPLCWTTPPTRSKSPALLEARGVDLAELDAVK